MHDVKMVLLKTKLQLGTSGIAKYMLGSGMQFVAGGLLSKVGRERKGERERETPRRKTKERKERIQTLPEVMVRLLNPHRIYFPFFFLFFLFLSLSLSLLVLFFFLSFLFRLKYMFDTLNPSRFTSLAHLALVGNMVSWGTASNGFHIALALLLDAVAGGRRMATEAGEEMRLFEMKR